jgi:predicted metallopeptidase
VVVIHHAQVHVPDILIGSPRHYQQYHDGHREDNLLKKHKACKDFLSLQASSS